MTQPLLAAARGGDCLVSYPGGDGCVAGCGVEGAEFVVGESELDGVVSGVACGGSASGSFGFHEKDITVKQKILAMPDLVVYDKYMNAHAGTTVAVSSTGMIHKAFVLGQGLRRTATASCASNYRYGAKSVYLRQIHELTETEIETGTLCQRCFA